MRAFITPASKYPGSRMGSTYSVPVQEMKGGELEEEKKVLTLQARSSYGPSPPPFEAWYIDEEGCFHVPRFYGMERFGVAETDERVDG